MSAIQASPETICTHQRKYVADWKSTDSDSVVYTFQCRDCPHRFEDEIVGSLVRSKGFDPEEETR